MNTENNRNLFEQLRSIVFNGLKRKNILITDTVLDRLNYELSVIEKQDYAEYFILYSRIVEICNELNLIRSYGRGSAPSSLVCFCLDITKINPIDENLIFESFILPGREYLPDIDLDIPKGYRDNVIQVFKQKYPEYSVYKIAYMLDCENEHQDLLLNNISCKKHPCGLIITRDNSIKDSVFTIEGQEYYLVLDKSNDSFYNNKIDLVEFDFLNQLQMLSIEVGPDYHPYNLPLNDSKVFEYLNTGDLDKIYHLGHPVVKQIVNDFEPTSIYDLGLIQAMYTKNLVNYIPELINNKFGRANRFKFQDDRINEILEETYGLLIYRESFLKLCNQLAGFSNEKAVQWHIRIRSDKTNSRIKGFITEFKAGCQFSSNLNNNDLLLLTNMMEEMLPLLSMKSHALSYAMIGYWFTYYKVHFKNSFDKVCITKPHYDS